MKKPILLLLALVAFAPTLLRAQPTLRQYQRIAAREERHRIEGKENNLYFTLATGITSHDQLVATFKAEYDRQIRGNLFWGVDFAARLHLVAPTSDMSEGMRPTDTVEQDIFKLDGMIYYRLPVIRSRLFFRVGTGIGLGLHSIREIGYEEDPKKALLPYLNLEAAWILRLSCHSEMKFSPTIILFPSEISLSPVRLPKPVENLSVLADLGLSLTFGWRF